MPENKKRILIVNNTGSYIVNFRSELIQGLQEQGYSVYAAFPFDGSEPQLEKKQVTCIDLKLSSYSKNIFSELQTIIQIAKLIRQLDLSLILPFTIKPVLYSSFASFFSNCKVISTITGMGKIYTDSSFKFRMASKVSDLAYRIIFMKNTSVIFQNPDDQHHFISKRILPKSKARLVNGSGINLKNHSFTQRNHQNDISFIMVARILKEKGVIEFCNAAANIIEKHYCQCTLIGGEVAGKELSFDGKSLTAFCHENKINFLGHSNNVPKLLNQHSIFVLPSYREGTPRSTLEALASGMPVITTDAPGTRETVEHGFNGLLIEARSTSSLEKAMEELIENRTQIEAMSKNSRALAESKFSVDSIVSNYINIISDASPIK